MNTESRLSHRPEVGAPVAPQPSAATRCSPAEEQVWLARLAACRRELLAIALLDTAAHDAVQQLAADLERGKLRIGAVIELAGGPPEAARERFEVLRAAIGCLADRGTESDALELAFQQRLALVEATPLAWDGTERVLEHSWVRAVAPAAASNVTALRTPNRHPRRLLPAPWRRRVRALHREIHGIIQRLVAGNQGLIRSVSRRYRGLGLSREDLMQEGNIGLLRAIEKFDATRGAPFGAYAVWWVRQSVRRALANQARTIRAPTTVLAARYALGRASSRLAHELGREPSDQELGRAAGLAPDSVADILSSVREPVSLDAPRGEDSSLTIGDRITDPDARLPHDQALAKDSALHLHRLLGGLSPREQLVLERRFGLGGADEQTLEEIGRSLDLTRERVRQIIAQALDRLQRKTRHAHLEL